MSLSTGTKLGPYEILAPLGAGGMGEVYRARDTKLGRDVALKILPDLFANDADRLARFQREAQVLASLNHPNIGAIYGLEDSNPWAGSGQVAVRALVLELVEGPTLADVIARAPMAVSDALPIAKQIAEALEAAHEQGIIHRDLKPANVKLRPDGTVKVLDFGLAKMLEAGGMGEAADVRRAGNAGSVGAGGTNSPTITSPAMMTGVGMILGTAAYMSPEQAKGRAADKRSDIWAFGCVLYEMLAGKRAFEGDDVSDTLAAVLRSEPDWRALPPTTPPSIGALLRRCLHKDQRQRLRDIGDAGLEIEEARDQGAAPAGALRRRTWSSVHVAWSAAIGLLLIIIAVATGAYLTRLPVEEHVYRAEIPLSMDMSSTAPASRMAVSPDGRQLAFTGRSTDGRIRLWLRPFDGVEARPLPGSDGAAAPFWSPDSRLLGYMAGGRLKKIDPSGGPATTLADAPTTQPTPASWNEDDVILFTPSLNAPLSRVSSAGGSVMAATRLDTNAGETRHAFPYFLPDRRHFLFLALNGNTPLAVYVGSLDSPERQQVMRGGSNVAYVQGYLMFLRETTLMAQAFDATRMVLTGQARVISEQITVNQAAARGGAFSTSRTGAVVYQTGGVGDSQLTWTDRSGRSLGIVGDRGNYADLELSSAGTHAAVSLASDGGGVRDVWTIDVARGVPSKLTFGSGFAPLWSRDGSRVVFNSTRKGHLDIFEQSANGPSNEQPLLTDDREKPLYSWSRDGRFVMFGLVGATTGLDLWVLPLSEEHKPLKPFPFVETPFTDTQAQFSPDGHWVAYGSNESGQMQVYVVPFPGPGGKRLVSPVAGIYPRWRADGKEIFYENPATNKLMAATMTGNGESLDIVDVRPLFEIQPTGARRYPYDVTADGQRFLVNVPDRPVTSVTVMLVVNWPALVPR